MGTETIKTTRRKKNLLRPSTSQRDANAITAATKLDMIMNTPHVRMNQCRLERVAQNIIEQPAVYAVATMVANKIVWRI